MPRPDDVLPALRDAVAGLVGPDGPVPGAVLGVVTPDGDAQLTALGVTAPGGSEPLTADALLRITSNTKPMVAALTMMLVEDGVLALDDAVDRFLPELADRRVVRRLDAPVDDTVPADRAATVDDLLTLRQGFGVVLEGDCPVQDVARAAGLGLGPPQPDPDDTLDDWTARFAALPLMAHPGTTWMYDLDYTVLGAVLARATGRGLDVLLRERLFDPLAMADTGFTAPPGRLVPCWVQGEQGLTVFDPATGSAWERPPGFPDGRGGLVSTTADLLRFAAFVLRGGAGPDGTSLLGAGSLAAMTTDQLTPAQREGPSARIFLAGAGWGRGVEVVEPGHGVQRDGHAVRTPRHRWAGGLGTLWVSYPERGVAAVLGTQVLPPAAPVFDAFGEALRTAVDG